MEIISYSKKKAMGLTQAHRTLLRSRSPRYNRTSKTKKAIPWNEVAGGEERYLGKPGTRAACWQTELPEYENCKLARISGQGRNHEFSIYSHVYATSITNVVDLHPIFLPES